MHQAGYQRPMQYPIPGSHVGTHRKAISSATYRDACVQRIACCPFIFMLAASQEERCQHCTKRPPCSKIRLLQGATISARRAGQASVSIFSRSRSPPRCPHAIQCPSLAQAKTHDQRDQPRETVSLIHERSQGAIYQKGAAEDVQCAKRCRPQ